MMGAVARRDKALDPSSAGEQEGARWVVSVHNVFRLSWATYEEGSTSTASAAIIFAEAGGLSEA